VNGVRVDQRRRALPWIALGVVYVLWGSTYLANRYIIVSMPPLLASGFRFMTGGLLLGLPRSARRRCPGCCFRRGGTAW
jgi:drug/metabolite transporter (DMT)-like permease